MKVTLDGDGGFTYHHHQDVHQQLIFKPVSVQALWTVIQTLHMIGERLRPVNNNPEEDDWIHEYKGKFIHSEINFKNKFLKKLIFLVTSPQSCINEWHTMADVLVRRPPSPHRTPKIQRLNKFEANTDFQLVIRNRLRQIMKSCNLGK